MIFKFLVTFTVLVKISAEQCTTPNNEIAECISLYSCPPIIKAIAAQEPISTVFARLSNCGGSASNPLVCCGSSSNFTFPGEAIPKESINRSHSKDLFPHKRYCGYQHSDDYFRPNIKKAEINEFPWLALLLYKDAQGNFNANIRCGGSLINARYILTAAHCVEDSKKRHYYLSGVHLGDFNVQSKIDCVESSGIQECSDPIQNFDIEETVVHPNYMPAPKIMNDIALIRLNRTAAYSDYIRPICLPFPGTVVAQVGDTLQASGWGKLTNRSLAETKKKIQSTLISNKECTKRYHDSGVPLDITEHQFCTVGISGNTDIECTGDNGGPLMFSHRHQWYQEGISSFGVIPCGKFPDIHTKVRNYMDWIQKTVKP